MTYALDSSALIELFENGVRRSEIVAALGDQELITASLCAQEFLSGADSDKQSFIMEELFKSIKVLPHTLDVAKEGARIRRKLSKAGKMINELDIYIAATCTVNNLEIIACDKDFAKIPGLQCRVIV